MPYTLYLLIFIPETNRPYATAMSYHMPSDSRAGGSSGAMGRAAGDEKLRQEGRLVAFSSPLALVHYIDSLLYPIQYRFVAQWSPTFFISRRTIELLTYFCTSITKHEYFLL